MSMGMMSPKPKGMQAAGNAGSRTPTGKVRPMPALDRLPSRSGSHPVEVVGRIREHPEGSEREGAIRVLSQTRVAVRAEGMGSGSREFSLDGVSLAAVESLQSFYGRYVESRVDDVKAGGRCTIMMYGPTGAGKSYTMFGAAHEKGVAYHALSQLMTQRASEDGEEYGDGSIEVRATVWEIYNEEVYDLLASVSTPKSGFGTLFKMSGGSSGRVSELESVSSVQFVALCLHLIPAFILLGLLQPGSRSVIQILWEGAILWYRLIE